MTQIYIRRARIIEVCPDGDFPFLISCQGRYSPAFAFYKGTECLFKKGDKVVVVDNQGIALRFISEDSNFFRR